MKVIYTKVYDPGEDKDCEISEIREEAVKNLQELVEKLQEFMKSNPDAEIKENCELEVGTYDKNTSEYTEMIFTTRD